MTKMYEVCENAQCDDVKSGNAPQHPLGTSICPTCGSDLVPKDPSGGLTQFIQKLPGGVALMNMFSGQSAVPRAASIVASSGMVEGNLNVIVLGVLPEMLDTPISLSYDFTSAGEIHPVTPEHPLCGDIRTGMLSIGAAHPYGDEKPGVDFAPFAAFPPHVSESGGKIAVAVSRNMANIRWDNGHFILIAGTGSNRPKLITGLGTDKVEAGRSMDPGTETHLENGAVYLLGDILVRFEHTA